MKEFLFEELSISDEVVNVSEKITQEILKESESLSWSKYKDFQVKNITITIIKDFDLDVIIVKLINLTSKEEYNLYINSFQNEYCHKSTFGINMLNLVLPCINGIYCAEYSNGVIQHEVEHAYQIFKRNGFKDDLFYNVANELTCSNNEVEKNIGMIIYYLDKREIDANANSLFNNLKSMNILNREEINKTQGFGEYMFIKSIIEEYINDDNLNAISPFFKVSSNKLKKYIEIQNKYLRIKFGKVIQNHFNKINVVEIIDKPLGLFFKD